MSDPARLARLERLYAAEPASPRAFLQLAEEYRRAGRFADAVRILEPGLSRNPAYPSAQFALGRTRLEMGDAAAAAELLGEVVTKDPTHMVATKLLAEARLRLGDASGAEATLDRYRLLNDGDPEIADLERRIEDLAADLRPSSSPLPLPAESPSPAASAPAGDPRPVPPAPPVTPVTPGTPTPTAVRPRTGVAADRAGAGEPFAALVAAADRGRYLAGLAAGGLFALPPEPPAAPVLEPSGRSEMPEVRVEEGVELAPPLPPSPPPLPPEPPAAGGPPPPPRWSGEEGEATLTLGQLYLDQQHTAEAERIFRIILDREPGNAAALLGLAEAEQARPRPLTAHDLLRWWVRHDGGGSARRPSRASLLEAYLARIRQRSHADVS